MMGTISVSAELQLNQAIATVDAAMSGSYVIQLTANIIAAAATGQAISFAAANLAAPADLYAFDLASGVTVAPVCLEVLVAAGTEAAAGLIVRLHNDAAYHGRMAQAALAFVADRFSAERLDAAMQIVAGLA